MTAQLKLTRKPDNGTGMGGGVSVDLYATTVTGGKCDAPEFANRHPGPDRGNYTIRYGVTSPYFRSNEVASVCDGVAGTPTRLGYPASGETASLALGYSPDEVAESEARRDAALERQAALCAALTEYFEEFGFVRDGLVWTNPKHPGYTFPTLAVNNRGVLSTEATMGTHVVRYQITDTEAASRILWDAADEDDLI